jgi:hypothetical protein
MATRTNSGRARSGGLALDHHWSGRRRDSPITTAASATVDRKQKS